MCYPEEVILDCNPTAYSKEEQLIRTLQEQLKDLPRPLIVNCDDLQVSQDVLTFRRMREQWHVYVSHREQWHVYAGGLTPKFQIMDKAPWNCASACNSREYASDAQSKDRFQGVSCLYEQGRPCSAWEK